MESLSNCSDPLYSPQTPHKTYPVVGTMSTPPCPTRHASCPGEDVMTHRVTGGVTGGAVTKVENLEVFMPAPRVDGTFVCHTT